MRAVMLFTLKPKVHYVYFSWSLITGNLGVFVEVLPRPMKEKSVGIIMDSKGGHVMTVLLRFLTGFFSVKGGVKQS